MPRINRLAVCATVVIIVGVGVALAQSGPLGSHGQLAGTRPYAAFNDRRVKALSAEQEDDLRNGRGMGLALAAELNGYPGPMHVLQLADDLRLSQDQKLRIEALISRMKSEAVSAGEKIVELEGELDKHFLMRTISAEILGRLTKDIGERQGGLRATHLRYHLETVAILSPEQVATYNAARGYAR